MIWFIYASAFIVTVLLALLLLQFLFDRRQPVKTRLREIRETGTGEEEGNELHRPFLERVIRPAFAGLVETVGSLAPGEIRGRINQKLVYAGSPWNLSANSFIAIQLISGLLFLGAAIFLVSVSDIEGMRAAVLVILLGAGGLFVPVSVLTRKATGRQMEMQRELPDMLDLLLVSVEAGLSFDMALKRVSGQMSGLLSGEIGRVIEEIRLGKIREEAFRGLVKRTGVQDLALFISAVVQSEQLGSNIANTLRIQAGSMRNKRRQRAEEAAMKAPVKMLFPMIFFIFPALLVVLLGPALINILKIFQDL